jgi:hypothetical protein
LAGVVSTAVELDFDVVDLAAETDPAVDNATPIAPAVQPATGANITSADRAPTPALAEDTVVSTQPGTGDKPTGDVVASDKPTGDDIASDKPSGDNGASDKPSGDNGASDKPSGDNGASDKPSGDNGTSDKPTGDDIASDKPSGDNGASTSKAPVLPKSRPQIGR